MTINHKKKLIFIHIPKNAGTSIIKAMGCESNFCIDKTIEEYKEHYKDYWKKYTKFTTIRDPVDRFISAYKFARMKESGWFSATGEEGLEKHCHYDICNSMDINGYVEYIYNNPKDVNRWVVPQSWIITDKNGNIEIDYYVKYESLKDDLEQLGISGLEKLNSSKIENEESIELTNSSKKLLSEIYSIDYKNFNFYKKPFQSISFQYS